MLYLVLSFGIDEPEPWYLLPDTERAYYTAAARDFLHAVATHQAKSGDTITRHMWVFVLADNAAKEVIAHSSHKYSRQWTVHTGGVRQKYTLGTNIFATEADALEYGRTVWTDYQGSLNSQIAAIDKQLSRVRAEVTKTNESDPLERVERHIRSS